MGYFLSSVVLKKLNYFFVIFLVFCAQSLYSVNIKEKISLGNSITPINSVSIFTNSLREKHLKNISIVDNYLTLFAQLELKRDANPKIKASLKQFFKQIGDNLNQINEEFKQNHQICEKKLENFQQVCPDSLEEMKVNIEFNQDYANSVTRLNPDYDRIISSFYDSNLYPIAKNVSGGEADVTNKNDVVNLYTIIAKHLDDHFHIFKSKEMEKILLQINTKAEETLDKFLTTVLQQYKQDSTDGDYVLQRRNLAQILFNKLSTYMSNAIERKSKLLQQSEELLVKMKENDQIVRSQIEALKGQRKENSELTMSLHKDNQLTLKKIKECEYLGNINSQCEESGKLYKTIINSYSRQTEAMQSLFKDLTNADSEIKQE